MWNELSKVDAPWGTVLGFSPEWIDEDYNPQGIRECFKNGNGTQWISSRWNNYHGYYVTDDSEEYGTKPTHWMPLPAPPTATDNSR